MSGSRPNASGLRTHFHFFKGLKHLSKHKKTTLFGSKILYQKKLNTAMNKRRTYHELDNTIYLMQYGAKLYFMHITEFSKYSLFKNHLGFQTNLKQLYQIQKLLELTVKDIQKNCSHKFCNIRSLPEKGESIGILLEKECSECGFRLEKPHAHSWQKCKYCWGNMEDMGQRLFGEDRRHYFKCTECGQEHWHT